MSTSMVLRRWETEQCRRSCLDGCTGSSTFLLYSCTRKADRFCLYCSLHTVNGITTPCRLREMSCCCSLFMYVIYLEAVVVLRCVCQIARYFLQTECWSKETTIEQSRRGDIIDDLGFTS